MDCEDGLGLMTVYQVYPGIQLIYNDFEATSCYWDGTIDKNVLEINHCREGREGSVLQSGSCLYLGEGIFPFIQWITVLLKWPFL